MNSGEVEPSASDARSGGQAPEAPSPARAGEQLGRDAPGQAQPALDFAGDPPGGKKRAGDAPGPGVLARVAALSPEDLAKLPREELERLHGAIAQHREVVSGNQLELYRPYAKQREFHAAGAGFRERAIIAANQIGKTWAGASEVAMHLTGRYPPWWNGRRYDRPIAAIAGSKSGALTRDGAQRLLFGDATKMPASLGTGTVPRDTLGEWRAARGVPNGIDSIAVRHVSGGLSSLKFKSYDQGRQNWQADTVELVWFDEEPDLEIYSEGMTRTGNRDDGMVFLTATPLLGMSHVVIRYLTAADKDTRHVTRIGLNDVPDYVMSAQRKQERLGEVPAHERTARLEGTPSLGEGAVFPIDEALIKVRPFTIPSSWLRLGGMDFGWSHNFAAVDLAWDRDRDVIYIHREFAVQHQTPQIHAVTLKSWGEELRWAWPHDGLQHSKDSGKPLRDAYKRAGLKMLDEHAQFTDGSIAVEAGVMAMMQRMETGKLKVFENLSGWWEEFRLYRREKGQIVRENDDRMSASRYGVVMIRKARLLEVPRPIVPPGGVGDYDPFSW